MAMISATAADVQEWKFSPKMWASKYWKSPQWKRYPNICVICIRESRHSNKYYGILKVTALSYKDDDEGAYISPDDFEVRLIRARL